MPRSDLLGQCPHSFLKNALHVVGLIRILLRGIKAHGWISCQSFLHRKLRQLLSLLIRNRKPVVFRLLQLMTVALQRGVIEISHVHTGKLAELTLLQAKSILQVVRIRTGGKPLQARHTALHLPAVQSNGHSLADWLFLIASIPGSQKGFGRIGILPLKKILGQSEPVCFPASPDQIILCSLLRIEIRPLLNLRDFRNRKLGEHLSNYTDQVRRPNCLPFPVGSCKT